MYEHPFLMWQESFAQARASAESIHKAFHCVGCEVLWRDNSDFSDCWICGVTVEKSGKQFISGKE